MTHRIPAPKSLVLAMASVAFIQGHLDFALVVLMNFFFILRPVEGIRATRANLVLPSDNCSTVPIAYMTIPLAKSRWKGPKTQHASMRDTAIIALLEKGFAKRNSLNAFMLVQQLHFAKLGIPSFALSGSRI